MNQEPKVVTFCNPEEASHALSEVISSASKHISIFSQSLHPMVFNSPVFIEACSALARKSRFSRVRVIVVHPRPLYGKDVPLIRLAQRLPTHLSVKTYVDGATKEDQSYLCIDSKHWVHFSNEETAEGSVNWYDRPRTKRLLENFDLVWQSGVADDPNFKSLTI